MIGTLRHLELHVMLDDHMSFVDAHDIAEQLEDEISAALGGALVSIHYEPYEAEIAHRMREHEGRY
jgi:ferrous-iron efflux pump FieF